MKKLLLSLAVVLGLMPAINTNAADATLTQKWIYSSEALGTGWDGTAPNWSSADAIKAQSCSRFATAKDGKIYILNMKTMSIAQITADGIKDLYKLPSLEGINVDVNGTPTPDYYGTSISLDQAGNFIIGHMFTKAQSVLKYTVYSPTTGKAKHFELNVPDGMMVMRNDCMGRVLGDMTKDAYAYIAPGDFVQAGGVVTPGTNGGGTYAANQKVRILHFTGNGDVDGISMTDSWSNMIYLGSHLSYNNLCQPLYDSMEAAKDVPATATFISASAYQPSMVDNQPQKPTATYFGFTAAGAENWGYAALGSSIKAATNGFDTFVLDGKRYYVRNNSNAEELNLWKAYTMDIAVYDEAFNIVATWSNPEYVSNQGYSSIIAEPVEGGANIYVYNSTGNINDEKKNWGVATMLFFSIPTGAPEGSAENPYKISTPEDLCAMNTKIVADKKVYFALQNDIDMSGVKDYKPVIGADGATYVGEFEFDGQNHVIKNFAPEAKYSYMSLFGVIRGNVKNLGVENAEIVSNSLGAGVIGGYGAQGGVECVIENVWATGSVTGSTDVYAGGLVGTNQGKLTIKNCYFRGDVFGKFAGGLVGRARADVSISNAYAAGSVSATQNAGGIAGTDKTNTLTITLNDVIAWNTSVDAGVSANAVSSLVYTADNVKVWNEMTINGQTVTDGVDAATLGATATAWEGFNSTLGNDGYPVLAWQKVEAPLGSEENPVVISTPEELVGLADKLLEGTTYVVLDNDIDMAGVEFKSILLNNRVDDQFVEKHGQTVHFDGRNHVIRNLTAQEGIFKWFTGSVKNLGVENYYAKGGNWSAVGVLFDYANYDCEVDNCWATGSVSGFYAGGLVAGVQNKSNLVVRNSYSRVNVTTPDGFAGGLVGPCNQQASLTIENCYASGDVTTTGNGRFAGGIAAGMNNNYSGADKASTVTLKNVASLNKTITGRTGANALVVPLEGLLTVTATDCLTWDGTLVNEAAVEGSVSKETIFATVMGWEAFADELHKDMPVLAWQISSAPLGSEMNPVIVSTPEELVGLADNLLEGTTYVALQNDIDMAGVEFKSILLNNRVDDQFVEKHGQTVHFDGRNHVIRNLTAQEGIFKWFTGSVKNLGVENYYAKGGNWSAVGVLFDYANYDCEVDNCWATGSVSGFYAGGLVAGVQNKSNLVVRNSYSRVNVTTPDGFAGGLVGPCNQQASLTIENCYASGDVTTTGNGRFAGGIAAGMNNNYSGADKASTVTLKNVASLNKTITGRTGANALVVPLEGLLTVTATDCLTWDGTLVNEAAVEGSVSKETIFATVMGWEAFNDGLSNGLPVLAWQNATDVVVETAEDLVALAELLKKDTCYNIVFAADIDMEGKTYKAPSNIKADVDGKCHIIKNLTAEQALFEHFEGTIKNLGVENMSNISTGKWGTAGTITSYVLGETTIENCFATGAVYGFYAGGIVAGVQKDAKLTIRNCYADVEVESPNGWAGGLVGPCNENAQLYIENCYASGDVTSANGSGGLSAGMNANYTANPATITVKNSVAWNGDVYGGTSAPFVMPYELAVIELTDVVAWNEMIVNDITVTDGKTTAELQALVTGWEAFNDKLNDGMPVLAWQDANGASAVSEIEAVDEDAAPVYYNLQGVRVQNPANGIYIVKRGSKVSKVFIR